MDLMWDGLYEMFVNFKVVKEDANELHRWVFVAGCGIVGVLAMLLDLALFVLKGRSMLSLEHSLANTGIFLVAWTLGACIIGFLGQMLDIFQVSVAASAVVGLSWPTLFTKILEKLKENEESSEAEQPTSVEEVG